MCDVIAEVSHKPRSLYVCVCVYICVCVCVYIYIYIHTHTHLHAYMYHSLSGACTKLRKATNRFVMSACPSVRPRGITRIPWDGFFKLNFMFENFRQSFEKIFYWNLTRIKGTLHAHVCTFMISHKPRSLCVCVCMYVYVCVCLCMYINICIYIYVYTDTLTCIHISLLFWRMHKIVECFGQNL